jgi:GT2 family glycosyltransferase
VGWYGEDTDLGWAVLQAGWQRAFADDAVIYHDVEERGVRWRIRYGYRERRNLMKVAARRPAFRESAFWRPWAFQRDDVLTTLAVAGLVLALKWRPALLLTLPYVRFRRPPRGHGRPIAFAGERFMVDVAQALGVAVGAATNGIVVV